MYRLQQGMYFPIHFNGSHRKWIWLWSFVVVKLVFVKFSIVSHNALAYTWLMTARGLKIIDKKKNRLAMFSVGNEHASCVLSSQMQFTNTLWFHFCMCMDILLLVKTPFVYKVHFNERERGNIRNRVTWHRHSLHGNYDNRQCHLTNVVPLKERNDGRSHCGSYTIIRWMPSLLRPIKKKTWSHQTHTHHFPHPCCGWIAMMP